MIKAVIFDYGNVMTQDIIIPIISNCAKQLGVELEICGDAIYKFLPEFDTNSISEKEFWEKICNELRIHHKNISWKKIFLKSLVENEEIIKIIKILKDEGYKIGLISNIEEPIVDIVKNKYKGLFHAEVYSCDEGIRKPDIKIFEIALKRLGVKSNEAVFIDDLPQNVEGARRIGINAIRFLNVNQVKKELAELGVGATLGRGL